LERRSVSASRTRIAPEKGLVTIISRTQGCRIRASL
jgi:hypothetical protein